MQIPMMLKDYFERAVQNVGRIQQGHGWESKALPEKYRFHALLKDLSAGLESDQPKSPGLTITDYRANPIDVRREMNFIKKQLLQQSTAADKNTASDNNDPVGQPSAPLMSVSEGAAKTPDKTIESEQAKALSISYGERSERQIIDDCIQSSASKYELPQKLIHLVVQAESGYRPHVVSSAGAQGLMQLMPGTAKELGVSDPFDIRQNIDGGVRYLKKMMDRFKGDVGLALAAYNAGPGNVRKYQGIPPFKETRLYVRRIMNKFEETV